ncbi:hypothetical protein Z949_4124 [Sulfitobacter guttiformis KCTC 32187]|uniref:Uncharacterized protein n=1 Tax=Sulfitobacter guttiformis TaxID=74349 RepID=A0A420DTH8_9RHOB|nr:hypothetical protein Z949_4124 [Sulfitobacter guttiformis KCTC 32187]RKE97480.1 hypothetical protein C8N30_2086 [Sulfitobacter guttiformis]
MREAFGVRRGSKLSGVGFLVSHIDYQAEEVTEKFLNTNAELFDNLRWDGDIGAISVRCEDGP